mgnify:CR=1 FL=1
MDQKSFVEYRTFLNRRTPTLEKVRRDGIRMYNEARYVIVLDETGSVAEKINRCLTSIGDILVVLSPIVYKKEKIKLAVVLEIGLSRATPYLQVKKSVRQKKVYIKSRLPVARLSEEATIRLMPEIAKSLQAIVDEELSGRRNLLFYNGMRPSGDMAKWGNEILSEMRITVSMENQALVYTCLAIDLNARENGHIDKFVSLMKKDFKGLKHSYYPDKQIKRFNVVKKIADILKEETYSELMAERIRKKLGKEKTKPRALFEQVVDVFNIKFKPTNENDHSATFESLNNVWEPREKELVERFPVSVITHPKRTEKKKRYAKKKGRYLQAKDCIRVGITVSKKALDKVNPPSTSGQRFINLSPGFLNQE